ncbi:uncharacterized protein LOC129584391 [Paramacrobiotus metropolitanus]|uniref:uncharacterized protein LOC129584391 n=1 Tax=Paramacrobiotus metropolitanus TaxID=2943436 RepID=UPI002445F8CC|nr:uncharacterized protein LOC129584391 [Paramacrobiotus metropolitanus]
MEPRITAVELPTDNEEEAHPVLCDIPIGSPPISIQDPLQRLESIRATSQSTITALKTLRDRIQTSRDVLAAKRDLQQNAMEVRIKGLERELGCVDIRGMFSQTEIDDLVVYVNNNPYLKSLLEKRNARLLQRLLECGSTAGMTSEASCDETGKDALER